MGTGAGLPPPCGFFGAKVTRPGSTTTERVGRMAREAGERRAACAGSTGTPRFSRMRLAFSWKRAGAGAGARRVTTGRVRAAAGGRGAEPALSDTRIEDATGTTWSGPRTTGAADTSRTTLASRIKFLAIGAPETNVFWLTTVTYVR